MVELANVIKTVAPWLGNALGGPLGGMAVGWACDKLGVSEKTTEALQQTIFGDAEKMLLLKQADQEFAARMQELGFKQITDIEALAVEDRKDARKMQIETRSRMPAFLATILTIGMLGLVYGILTDWLRPNDSQIAVLLIGTYTTVWLGFMAFYSGTTARSATKDNVIATLSREV